MTIALDTKPQKLKYVDKNHAYYIDGKRAKSVTTVAKVPEDGYALELWGKRMVAIGLASSPALIESTAAHFDDRDKLNEIVEEAETLAKTHQAATRGTAMHRATERVDRNEPMLLTDLLARTVHAWKTALDAFEGGYDVIPEFIERAVVYPEQRICGRFDRIVRRRSDGKLRILDLKSGERALKYPHSIAIQLALYVNAPWMAAAWEGESGEAIEFEQLPAELDREIGLVLHMPEPHRVSFAEVDIAAGWEIARKACFPILDWRGREDLVTVTELELGESTDDDPFVGVNGEAVAPSPSPQAQDPLPTPAPASAEAPSFPRVEWIAGRIAVLPTAGQQLLAARWSETGVQSPKAMRAVPHRDYTDDEIAAINVVLEVVETEHEAPFPPPDPCAAVVAPEATTAAGRAAQDATAGEAADREAAGSSVEQEPQGSASPVFVHDEGDPITDDDVDAIAKAIAQASHEQELLIRSWLTEMKNAGTPLGLTQVRSRRRWSIARAVLGLSVFDDEIARTVTGVVTGDELAEDAAVGVALFGLSIDEAERAADMARALEAGTLAVGYTDDGVCQIIPAP